jgi:type II secretory pathway component GspD/PulD (secretin)
MIVSQLEPGLILGNTATRETNTTTHMITANNKTIVLSGFLYQTDTRIERKLPLLGDIPLLGALFRHYSITKTNKEILVLITPEVVIEEPGSRAEMMTSKALETLQQVKEGFDSWLKEIDKK